MSKAKQKTPIQFRPTDDLEDYLRAKAKEAFRSINQEILFRLELSRRADQQPETKGASQ
ncbi:hypothetical protein HMPREF9701_03162 [Delftia acidovorans CCUG 274B]|uniref:hypothetical protein n=1 Tax=Delftia TaxID=80865 RepID=UPI00034E178F|nr:MULTISPECIES: hypothetical protein [Delftia]EPD35549.1 hypothetical protein HMPREF9702_05923 [Delftia acidovorans CCUG 15835]EPD39197.1 hypothetical protein HMPREF9701_03162 [Delftia acidovorans CCUG 274B]